MDSLFSTRWRAGRGAPARAAPGSGARRGAAAPAAAAPDADRGPGTRLARASGLMDDPLYSSDGVQLGQVSELLLDVEQGRIAYAVMVWGGFMGLGERLFPIPYAALHIDERQQRWVIDADRARFADAPAFDQASWPSLADAAWHESVHRHYGVRPYWRAAAASTSAPRSQTPGAD